MTLDADMNLTAEEGSQEGGEEGEELWWKLEQEALEVERQEPELSILLRRTLLAECVSSFEDAVASTVCYRLLLQPCINLQPQSQQQQQQPQQQQQQEPTAMFCPHRLKTLIRNCMDSPLLELGHTMAHAIREDALAVCRRDPAMDSLLQVVLFSKGYAALVCHRAAHRLHLDAPQRTYTAQFLQSQASAVFGLDLHPLARIGCGVMLDHGTGVVIGETATVGDGSTLLHGVTLGGTGKDRGDRHPKVGANVLIGAGASLLGNIRVGDGAKIGAGSVVLRDIPPGATAVGAPAKIIGRASESRPGSDVDETLEHVSLLHKSESSATVSTALLSSEESEEEVELFAGRGGGGGASSDSGTGPVMCPYREYTRMAKMAPPGTVTICTLHKILDPMGCTSSEIGSCLFALDTKNVGYVHLDVFRDRGVNVLTKYTRLDEATVETLVTTYLAIKGGQL